MRFISNFSGIEAASVAWHPLGFECAAVAEVEPFPCAVLAHHYPDVPNLGDVLADDFLDRVSDIAPDVIVGGPPCQDFSVAGLRAGLNGHRGNLTLRWVQIIHASRAGSAVTENVPGWLSANNGHAFGAFLAGLVGHDTALLPPKDCGGRWTNAGLVDGPNGRACWRVLDAQFFGLAQRRKRVFVVFCPGHRNDPAAVLFESKSLRRDTAPRRETRERIAASLAVGADGGGLGTDFYCDGGLIAGSLDQSIRTHAGQNDDGRFLVSHCLNAHGGTGRIDAESETFVTGTLGAQNLRHTGGLKSEADMLVTSAYRTSGNCGAWDTGERVDALNTFTDPNSHVITHSLRADGFDASEDGTGRGTPLVASISSGRGWWDDSDVGATIRSQDSVTKADTLVSGYSAVRRLTPRECERLQGFPDDYTLIPYRNKPAADGPRYRALGNSMAVPCMAWIGRRITQVSSSDLSVAA